MANSFAADGFCWAEHGDARAVAVAVLTAVLIASGAGRWDAVKLLARIMIRRWDINDEVAMFIGTAVVVVC